MKRYALAVLFVVLFASCRSAAPIGPPAAGASVSAPATSPAAAMLPDSIRWVGAAEYAAAFEQGYRSATSRVEAEAPRHAPGSWAVILDADETVISNVTYQAERARAGLPYSEESWNAWVRRREATPLPGAAAFLARVHALGGRVAIVTNRLQSVCPDTEAVFARYALAYDAMLCRVDGT